jgi:PTS system cellobiose-specific IIA component
MEKERRKGCLIMDYQALVMQLIVNGGDAKSKSMEAVHLAKTGRIDEARVLHEQACDDLARAHEIQSALIREEAAGTSHEVTLLMVHAQDHLMNAITVKDLTCEMIDLYEQIHNLNYHDEMRLR